MRRYAACSADVLQSAIADSQNVSCGHMPTRGGYLFATSGSRPTLSLMLGNTINPRAKSSKGRWPCTFHSWKPKDRAKEPTSVCMPPALQYLIVSHSAWLKGRRGAFRGPYTANHSCASSAVSAARFWYEMLSSPRSPLTNRPPVTGFSQTSPEGHDSSSRNNASTLSLTSDIVFPLLRCCIATKRCYSLLTGVFRGNIRLARIAAKALKNA